MDGLAELLNGTPFVSELGIEVLDAADGVATGRLELADRHSSVPGGGVAHGGVTYALADTVGGAAAISLAGEPTPTIDMRIDYLAPAKSDLRAEATVVRAGGTVTTVSIRITDADDTHVADAQGTFKSAGGTKTSAWGTPTDAESADQTEDNSRQDRG